MHVPLDSGPGYNFGFVLFFCFLCFCVYSAIISEKLQPASGDCLSPLGVLVIGFSPTDQSITMIPAFSVRGPTHVIVCTPQIASRHVCDHAGCHLSLCVKGKMDSWLQPSC